MATKPIQFTDWFKGESIAKNEIGGFDSSQNLDVHTSTLLAQCQLALTSDNVTITEPCYRATAPNGDVYFFSSTSGKTWKRTSGGTVTLVNTNANGAHAGARYFNGYIYYATSTKLGRFDLASTWADSWATFSNGDAIKDMEEINLSLFITDGKYIAAVNAAGTFEANSLDLPANFRASTLAAEHFDLAIGSIESTGSVLSKFFLWDTYSSSWTSEDEIFEIGINCFIKADNLLLALCGTEGNLYYWNGSAMVFFRKIRGVTSALGHQLSTVLKGKPLVAIGTEVYSIHRSSGELPIALTEEFTAASAIVSIVAQGSQLFVAHQTGLQKIGTNYATATVDTPEYLGRFRMVEVYYDSLPSGCSIGIATQTDVAGSYTSKTPIVDAIRKRVFFDGGLGLTNSLQARITLTPSGANTPKIRAVMFK